MDKVIGFIGTGNMGAAIIKGLLDTGFASPENIVASRRNQLALDKLKSESGIQTTSNNTLVASKADILFIAVKPNVYESIIEEVRTFIKADAVIVNIAAGKSIHFIEDTFQKPVKVARAMPNTPALVGEGMIGICFNEEMEKTEREYIVELFSSIGKVEVVAESLLDAVVGVSGSSPAILYMIIEAMADGAVKSGMPRQQAYTFAAQAMLGSAKMVLETGIHPGELKDQVCSPGGTTIEAVTKAEETGLRSSILAAVEAAVTKSVEMTKES